MKLLTPLEKLNQLKSRDMVEIECLHCGRIFQRVKSQVQKVIKGCKNTTFDFCSRKCMGINKSMNKSIQSKCENCGKDIKRGKKEFEKCAHHFCSYSCSAKYHNAHKTTGTNRSKLEQWMESRLVERYPKLDFHFNRRDTINAELDIYIPSLKLAFEFNGIFHYEPIFGKEKLSTTQDNDKRKFQACLERSIEFVTIDISGMVKFKDSLSLKYLDIVVNIIDSKMAGHPGLEPGILG